MTKAEQVEVIRKKIEFEKGFLDDEIKKEMKQGKYLNIVQLKKLKKNNLNLMRVVTAWITNTCIYVVFLIQLAN